ncbi:MAG: serine/threonine protein kinase, partial [Candidatus Brocadiae bacterium]|nr:serine/threonine protein kinase [Candidatus Brocadiia bacterium]
MPRDPDLLYALLALQLGHLTREQLLDAAAAWLNAPTGSLASHIESRGLLTPAAAAALRSAVEARGRESASAPALPPPSSPGRYRLLNELGRGGLGRVVEAWDESLRRGVAIKVLHGRTSPDLEERFAREARLAARLEHPSIVPIHDFGTLEDGEGGRTVFLCMKRIRGRDLEKVLWEVARGPASGAWTRARLLRVFQDACLGMAFAHDRGVIHRDLKPSNVMLGDYGETLIVDWGLAKELAPGAIRDSAVIEGEPVESALPPPGPEAGRRTGDSTTVTGGKRETPAEPHARTLRAASDREDVRHSWGANLTFAGDILGTPAYMSPEQAEGRVDEVDARSDIWALGAILYEILATRPPFVGNDVQEVIAAVRGGTVVPPSEARAALDGRDPVPPELDAICLRALARSRDARYQSARALHDD